MRMSKSVTKIVVRVFFILLLFALVPFFYGDPNKFRNIYFAFPNKWMMVFPLAIIGSFLFLLITCAVKKYKDPEINWLLVVNTIVLTGYGIAIFIKVSHLI
jgi:cytochrome bd-type quinol oxidase subunit 2